MARHFSPRAVATFEFPTIGRANAFFDRASDMAVAVLASGRVVNVIHPSVLSDVQALATRLGGRSA
jgi:hypothetical protein